MSVLKYLKKSLKLLFKLNKPKKHTMKYLDMLNLLKSSLNQKFVR